MNIKHRIALVIPFLLVGMGAIMSVNCTKQQSTQIETALTPLLACEVNELLGGALTDPLLLITGCAGATAQSLWNIGVALLNDATTVPPDAGPGYKLAKLTPLQLNRLRTSVANLAAYMSDGGK
jgi:hypothetical protein